ncbi:MAG: GDP-mannose 4,6-dehydratase [Promethearchaeia archaeon]
MKSILITGADGFLGSHLTDFCIEKEFEVIGLKRPNTEVHNLRHYLESNTVRKKESDFSPERIEILTSTPNFRIIECDIKNAGLLRSIILQFTPDLIFHFAAQPYVIPSWEDPRDTIETNVIGSINIFEPVKNDQLECRIVVACSSAEYGTTTEKVKRPLREEDRLKAVHPYGISKIAAELMGRQYFLNFDVDVVNLRYFNQTGPRKVNDACSDFVRQVAQIELGLKEPEMKVGNLNPFRDILGVKDSIQASWFAATEGKAGETYNVCSGRKSKIRDILEIALSFSSKEIEVHENTPAKLRKTDEDVILGDNSKLKELGFDVSQTIPELLREMYDYWLEYYRTKKEKS